MKAHWLIRKVERYYIVLHCIYQIISKELPDLDKEMALQIAIKAINNIVGLNGLVPIFLVFSAFF